MRTHVLQIVGNAIVGGMENCVARLVERLPRESFEVTLLAPYESPFTETLRGYGAEVCVADIAEDPSWQSIQIACGLIHARGVDIVHSHLPNAHVLAGLAGRLTGRPVLATVHGLGPTLLDIEVQRTAGSHLGVVCQQARLNALGAGVDPAHVHFVPNGVDTERFHPAPERHGALRRRLGIGADALVVGFVGRLAPEKGPDVFLSMALAVQASRPGTQFVVVGEGPMLAALELYALRFGIADSVHFAGVQSDMAAVFNELDIAVSSSRSEAMPFAVMEAMASGLPVVACKVGGVADLVLHGVTGWIANPGDHDGLAQRVIMLIDDAELRRAAGRAGRARAAERYPLARSVEATASLLVRLAAPRSEPRRGIKLA